MAMAMACFDGVVRKNGPFDADHPWLAQHGLRRNPDETLLCGLIVNMMFKGTFAGYNDTHLFVTFKSLGGKDVQGQFLWCTVQSLVISQDWASAFLDIQRTTPPVDAWFRMRSRTRPETFYFWNKDTCVSTMEPPPLSPRWLLCSYGQHLFRVNHNSGEVKDGATVRSLPLAVPGAKVFNGWTLTSDIHRICVDMMKKSAEDVTAIDVSSMTRKILSNFETFHAMPAGSATLEKVSVSSASLSGWAAYLPRSDGAESESKRLRIS